MSTRTGVMVIVNTLVYLLICACLCSQSRGFF